MFIDIFESGIWFIVNDSRLHCRYSTFYPFQWYPHENIKCMTWYIVLSKGGTSGIYIKNLGVIITMKSMKVRDVN